MADFTALLKMSVAGMNDGYNQAKNDLAEVITQLNTSIQEVTHNKVGLRVSEGFKTAEASIFNVVIFQGSEPGAAIGAYRIFRRGYPIPYSKLATPFIALGELKSKVELERHFSAIVCDRESPIVMAVAFALRR